MRNYQPTQINVPSFSFRTLPDRANFIFDYYVECCEICPKTNWDLHSFKHLTESYIDKAETLMTQKVRFKPEEGVAPNKFESYDYCLLKSFFNFLTGH